MFQNIIQTVKNSPFASPFQAKCESPDGLKVNEIRTIAAASAAPGSATGLYYYILNILNLKYKVNYNIYINFNNTKYISD